MAEWRFLEGWSNGGLRRRLDRLRGLPVSFHARWDEMTLENGWSHVESRAVIAHERKGPPEPNGAFVRASHLVEAFKHSDPRIVKVHYDAHHALRRRRMLLELQSSGLRFLCPVLIEEVRSEQTDAQSVFGFSFVTLKGHLERGREWFLLTKDHATGEIRFHIEAKWQEGDFPNFWSQLGFQLLGRRYQRAWHRLAHIRLRRLIAEGAGAKIPGRGLRHEGDPFEHEPIQLMAQRGSHSRRIDVEQEVEHVQRDRWGALAGLAALTGARSLAPFALLVLAGERHRTPLLPKLLDRRRVPAVLAALAAGELVADKLPWVPDRTQPPALLERALLGAMIGFAFARRGRRRTPLPAAIGAGAAVAGTFASHAARASLSRRLGLPSAVAGAVEDAVVLSGAGALAARII